MTVKRGVMFELQTSVAQDADRAFSDLEARVHRLQGMMGGLTLGFSRRATAGASVFTGVGAGSSSNGNGNGNGHPIVQQFTQALSAQEQAERSFQRRREAFRREADERDRIRAERSAKLVEKANREALDQQVKDLRRSEADKQKALAASQRARDVQFRTEQKADADFWKGFAAHGKQTGAQRQKQEQIEARDEAKRIQLGNRQLASLVRGGPQAQKQDQQRAERDEQIALARQREGYHRLTESIGGSVDAITRLGEGAAYLGLIGKRDLGSLTDSLLKIRGIANVVTGGVRSAGDFGGLLRNLHAVHKTGGMGGVGRALMGLGPAAGGAANLGAVPGGITAAFSAPAGVIVGGIAAALTLAADQALIGGRFTKALGRSVGHGLVGTSQGLHSLVNMLETLGMEEHERKAIERRRLTQMEDPNNPRGAGLSAFGSGFGVFDAAAATARNAERLQIISGQRQQQRATFRQIGNLGLAGDFQISAMQRERENSQAEIDRKLSATYLHANLTPYFLGSRDRYGRPGKSLVRSEGQTGIGELTGAFATGGIFSGATNIRDQGERMRFLQARRDASHEFLVGQNRIKQQLQSLAADRERVVTAAAQNRNADNPNQESERQTAEQLNRLDQERARLTRESDELHQRMRQRDIQDAAKLLEYSKQNADVAKDRLSQATRRLQSTEERIGAMNPLQVANIAQAKRRALASKDLSKTPLEDVYTLQNGDEQSQDLARQVLRARAREMANDVGLDFGKEERSYQSATRNAETVSAQLGERSKALQGVTNEVIVGGDYHVTIDIRDDMQLAEQLHAFEASIEQRFREHDQKVIAAIHAAVDAASKNIHQQGKNSSQ